MRSPHPLEIFFDHIDMFLHVTTYDAAVSFIDGFNYANHGATLTGLREWLIPQVNKYSNMSWSVLVLHLAFPGTLVPRDKITSEEIEEKLVKFLFDLFRRFFEESTGNWGFRLIYLKYDAWLRRQSWYGPGSPDWIPLPIKRERKKTKGLG